MIVTTRDAVVGVDYHQFYLNDTAGSWDEDQLTDADFEAHLASYGGFVYVGTGRQWGSMPLRLEVHDAEPSHAVEAQHVAEVSVVTGGSLGVYSWGENHPECVVELPPGPVRLRALWAGLLGDADQDDDYEDVDRMVLQLWPAPESPRRVLRCWREWALPEPAPRSADGRRQVEGLEEVLARLDELQRLPLAFPNDNSVPFPGEPSSPFLVSVYADLRDGSWWADGYGTRRTLREITEDEVKELMRVAHVSPHPENADPRLREMLRRVAYPMIS